MSSNKEIITKINTSNALSPPSSGLVTRLNRLVYEPMVMPGQYIRIQQGKNAEIFQLSRLDVPEPLPPVKINLASFTSTLAALTDTGSPQSKGPTKLTSLDMPNYTLAQYRFVGLDEGVLYELFQPASVAFMENKDGSIAFSYDTTMEFYLSGLWSMLPEAYVYQDSTTISCKITNMDMGGTTPYARILAFGFKYPLVQIPDNEIRFDEDTGQVFREFTNPRTAAKKIQQIHPMTVSVGRGNRR